MTDAWNEHYSTEAGARYWPNTELVAFCAGKKFDRVLDVGAGTGANLRLLIGHAEEVACIEPNTAARRQCMNMRERLDDRCCRCGDITITDNSAHDTGYDDKTFDLVVDCMTSQHIPWAEHPAVYAEYARVLWPGGRLWLYHLDSVTDPQEWTPHPELWAASGCDYSYLSLFPTLDMFCLPHPDLLANCVREAGFEDDAEVRGLAREYPDGQVAHYTIIAARKA